MAEIFPPIQWPDAFYIIVKLYEDMAGIPIIYVDGFYWILMVDTGEEWQFMVKKHEDV